MNIQLDKTYAWRHLSILFLLCVLFSCPVLKGQCQFSDDYSDAERWTQVGSLFEIASGSAVFLEYCPDGEQRRIYTSLGDTLDSQTTWKADIDFNVIDIGAIPIPAVGHNIIALTAGTMEPLSDCPDIPCTGNPQGTQDGIMVMYATPDTGSGDVHFKIVAKSGTQEITSAPINNNVLDTWFYITLERLAPDQVRLGVYSDAGRTKHIDGSPILMTIPESVTDLTHVQHGNVARWDPQRQLLGKVDNLCIEYSITSSLDGEKSGRRVTVYPNPTTSVTYIEAEKPVDIMLFDRSGSVIKREKRTRSVDLSTLPPGVYFLKMKTKDHIVFRQLIRH